MPSFVAGWLSISPLLLPKLLASSTVGLSKEATVVSSLLALISTVSLSGVPLSNLSSQRSSE
jgi:hypothetical protein